MDWRKECRKVACARYSCANLNSQPIRTISELSLLLFGSRNLSLVAELSIREGPVSVLENPHGTLTAAKSQLIKSSGVEILPVLVAAIILVPVRVGSELWVAFELILERISRSTVKFKKS